MAGKDGVRLLAQRRSRLGKYTTQAFLAFILLTGSISSANAEEEHNVSFAEPDYALLATKNAFARGSLGIVANSETHKTPDGRSYGALRIQHFTTGSPLPGAGVQIGDAVVAVNSYIFSTGQRIVDFINTGSPGAYVNILIATAGGNWRTVNVPLVSLAGSVPAASLEKPISIPEQSETDRSDTQGPRSTNSEGWVGTALAVGAAAMIGCVLLGCFDSDGEASASASNGSDYRDPDSSQSSGSGYDDAGPDTSIGCAWGDRAYGTCR